MAKKKMEFVTPTKSIHHILNSSATMVIFLIEKVDECTVANYLRDVFKYLRMCFSGYLAKCYHGNSSTVRLKEQRYTCLALAYIMVVRTLAGGLEHELNPLFSIMRTELEAQAPRS